MNLNRDHGFGYAPFKETSNDNFHRTNILPPFPDGRQNQKINEIDFDNLKEFRSRILEMDDEIKQLKNIEREKHLLQQRNEYSLPELHFKPKIILKDESVSTTETLLQEQTNRIAELERQFEKLKIENANRKPESHHNESHQENRNIKVEDLGDCLNKEFEDAIAQRIGTWTPKDPHQGPMQNLYFPFGSPGGGAPRRDNNGRIQTTMVGDQYLYINSDDRRKKFLASQILNDSLQKDMLQQRLRRLQDKQQIREPNGDFCEYISNFKVGRPKRDPFTGMLINNHLSSSDVTNMKIGSSRTSSPRTLTETNNFGDADTHNYGMELTRAAKERQIMKHLDKLREQQECKQHLEAWNNIWGGERSEMLKQQSLRTINAHVPSNHRNYYQIQN